MTKKKRKKRRSNSNYVSKKATNYKTDTDNSQGQKKSLIRRFWAIIGFIALVLGLLGVGFLDLRTNISIEHASSILPVNLTALPIKILNQGKFPVYVESVDFTDNIQTLSGIFSFNNDFRVNVSQNIGPGQSIDKMCDIVNFHDPPISGFYNIKLHYQSWILKKQGVIEEKFYIYRNKDSTYTWTNQPIMINWPDKN